jgi:hypothetical protein
MLFLVWSQSFPHLWKKLWKITSFGGVQRFQPDLSGFPEGRNLGTASNSGLASTAWQQLQQTARLPGAKVGRRLFFLNK